MNSKCPYCQRECRLTSSNPKTYQCDYHGSIRVQIVYPLGNSGSVRGWHWVSFICRYKETNYRFNFFHGELHPDHPKFTVSKLHFDPKKPSETIFALDFHPEITPENVEAKLPTYLIFS